MIREGLKLFTLLALLYLVYQGFLMAVQMGIVPHSI